MKTNRSLTCVLIMAGGTGGHVFSGLAVARYLLDHGVTVHWLGAAQGLEASLVPAAGIPLHLVTIGGLRGKGIKPLLLAPFKIMRAISQSARIMKAVNPDVVLGMGGFVSGPGGVACWLRRRPLVIHEQNAKAGMTNQCLAYLAKRILAGFPSAFRRQTKVWVVGNPVRQEIEALPAPLSRFAAPRSRLRLLVLGGSLGAQALNEMVPRALSLLPPNEHPLVLHQTGKKNL